MTAARFHLSRTQLSANDGTPLNGGTVQFYTGGTLVNQNTYSDAGLSSANANPITLGSDGRLGDVFLLDSTYRVIIKDSGGTTVADFDNVYKDVTFIRSNGLPAVSFPNMIVHNTADGIKYRRNSAGSGWINEGPIDSVGNAAAVSDVVAATSTTLFVTPDSLAAIWERGADIASAATLSIPATGGNYFEVTGNTGISGINSQRAGTEVWVRFTGTPLLTNGASFVLIGATNIQVVAGAIACFRNASAVGTSGTTWRMVHYIPVSGSPVNITDFIATQAEIEADTVITDAISPGRARFSPTSIKAEGNYNQSGTAAFRRSYGHSGLTDNGVGDSTLTYTTTWASADYSFATCSNQIVSGTHSATGANLRGTSTTDQTTTTIRLQIGNAATGTLDDRTVATVISAGDFP